MYAKLGSIDLPMKMRETSRGIGNKLYGNNFLGWDNTKIIKGLDGVMNLAAASGEDLGLVSDIVTDSMTAFGMKAEQSGEFADLLAATASSANTNVAMLGESFKYAAPVAGALGFSARDTSLALGLMANAGIKASMSGTSLRSIMTRLVKPTKESQKAIDKLGIKILDSKGEMKSFDTIIQDLRTAFKDLTPAQKAENAAMLGGKTAMSGLLAMVNTAPADFNKLSKALDNSKGSAKKMADIMQQNLAGQLKILQSSIAEIALQFSDILMPALKFIVSGAIQPLVLAFGKIPKPIKAVIVIASLLLASLGPIILVIGTIITLVASLVTGIGVIAVVLPIIGIIVAVGVAVGAWYAALGILIAKLGIFKDAIASVKAIMSGSFQTMFDLLHKKFGMSSEQASILAKRFKEISDKAKVVAKVIEYNLGIAMEVLGDVISNLMSGGMADLNSGTQESKNLFSDMVQGIIKWGGQLADYLYGLFDTFGLIPIEMKFNNNKIAGEYAKLEADTNAHFNTLLNSQFRYGDMVKKSSWIAYDKKLAMTKTAMNKELELVTSQIIKKRDVELAGAKKLFKDNNTFTDAAQKETLRKVSEYYDVSSEYLKNNIRQQQEILSKARKEKRMLNANETETLKNLHELAGKAEIEFITTNKAEQRRILEESKRVTLDITRTEALGLVASANTVHDKQIETANKTYTEKMATIIRMRDDTKVIDDAQANALMDNAETTKNKVISDSLITKDQTVDNANLAAGGILTAEEKKQRDVETSSDKILAIMTKIWNDIKVKIPGIVRQLGLDIKAAINKHKPAITAAATSIGNSLMDGLMKAILDKMGPLGTIIDKVMGVTKRINTATTDALKSSNKLAGIRTGVPSGKPWTPNANGTINSPGGMTLVGERGPELINLPKGSQVFSNQKSKNMITKDTGDNNSSMYISGIIKVDTGNGLENLSSKAIQKIVADSIINNKNRYVR